jgi:ferredoxin-thioredoxin reductase catalytic subunit
MKKQSLFNASGSQFNSTQQLIQEIQRGLKMSDGELGRSLSNGRKRSDKNLNNTKSPHSKHPSG